MVEAGKEVNDETAAQYHQDWTLMHHIRPYKLFALVDAQPPERTIQMTLPFRRGAGGVTVLEMSLILAAARAVEAKRVFEFGTFLGSTTLNLALNTPDHGEVFTLDLDEHHAKGARQDAADQPLTEIHLTSKATLDFTGSPVAEKITMLTGDSTRFDFTPWRESIDCVFIDGGHDFDTVKSDTENALRLARRDGASCILWHDYQNRDYSGLTYYLDELSREETIAHIEDTRLCVWFHDPGNSLLPRLLGS